MITITAPSGQLLADQRGQFFYSHQGQTVSVPPTSCRWDLADMTRLWSDMCAATGDAYVLRISPLQVSPG